ncbi:MAG: exodeoxyribonuclease III [Planctomycetes bacterium]|nr:exodeoxyribonuclease III [Planctomycetota bacterium]
MRCVSWNVNGIRAVSRKELLPWDQMPDVDLFALQETKARTEQVKKDISDPKGWHSNWFSAKKPGYSGVAIYSRTEPDEVYYGMEDDTYDDEGRVIGVTFDDLLVVSAYFPNSQEKGKRIDYKLGFCKKMEEYLDGWRDAGYKTLLLGDYNIAHQPIDLARPEGNEQNPGYLPAEREWMTHYLGLGYHDVFREENPTLTDAYSWWSYRTKARERNIGWRIDYATVSPELRDAVTGCEIHDHIEGSDHCPVSIDLAL